MKFSVFQLSRLGGRKNNEDRMGYCYTREAVLLMLADGMGGHPEGEVAAQLALQSMSLYFQQQAKERIADLGQFLTNALMRAHHHILRYAASRGMLETPRTTLVAALLQKGRAVWIHCGDSRLYLVRDGQLLTRTRDHSYLEMAERVAQPPKLANRNVLFTCLGSPSTPLYDVTEPLTLKRGDKLLLCSDGLWGSLQETQIVNTLHTFAVSRAVPWLIDGALSAAGAGSDNVTAIALEWQGGGRASTFGPSGISTYDIADGGFESTVVQPGKDDEFFDGDLNDAEIERSIAEINEAILRTSKPQGK